jgi:2-amino-4-hydroxy-6-hydroxymethyldihydropteridine diphosphokinase
MGTLALIGLGSNLGDRKAHLDAAIAALAGMPGVIVRAVSSYHDTAPVGGPGGQGAFLNAAAAVETALEPERLLDILNSIEDRAGRLRTARWGERTLDLDLLLFEERIIETPRLVVPHPRMAVRRFVLAPLGEIAHAAIEPMTGRTIAELLANLDRRPSYVALHGGDGPFKSAVFRGVVAGLGAKGLTGDEFDSPPTAKPDPLLRLLDQLVFRARKLPPEDWPAERLGDCWMASDFCLPLDHRQCAGTVLSRALKNQGRLDSKLVRLIHRSRVEEALSRAIPPTFAVILGPEPVPQRGPEHLDIPLLWPESSDPDDVVAEILATCAATRTG